MIVCDLRLVGPSDALWRDHAILKKKVLGLVLGLVLFPQAEQDEQGKHS